MGDIESSQVAPLRVIDLRVMNVLADSPNIFHVFALEVNRVFQLTVEAIECDWAVLIQPTHRSIWRGFVLSGLLPVFCDESEIDRDYVLVSLPPLDSESWLVDPHQFLCYPTSSMWRAMVRRILVRHECCSEADHLIDVILLSVCPAGFCWIRGRAILLSSCWRGHAEQGICLFKLLPLSR